MKINTVALLLGVVIHCHPLPLCTYLAINFFPNKGHFTTTEM